MERMTRWSPETKEAECEIDGVVHTGSITTRLAEYEDTGLDPEEVRGIKTAYDEVQIPYEVAATGADAARVIRLLEADDEGRLVVLPCKVGDTVWFNTYKNNATECVGIQPHEVKRVNVYLLTDGAEIPKWEIGKTVFLTREDAEKALKKLSDKACLNIPFEEVSE